MNQKCPYCGNEMESGYIQCRDGITWTKKKCLVASLSTLSRSAVHMGVHRGPFAGDIVSAQHCANCKKVIIDYTNTAY